KFGNQLESQQEVLMKLADIAIHLYASESIVLRVKKRIEAGHDSALMNMLLDTSLEEALHQVLLIVRQLEQEVLENEKEMIVQINAILMGHSFSNSINRNRTI